MPIICPTCGVEIEPVLLPDSFFHCPLCSELLEDYSASV